MKKLIKLFMVAFMVLTLTGCQSDINSQIKETITKAVSSLNNFNFKSIAYMEVKEAYVDDQKYEDVYIAKVSSDNNPIQEIYFVLDKDAKVLTSQSYSLDMFSSINYVYPITIKINDKQITNSDFTEQITIQ